MSEKKIIVFAKKKKNHGTEKAIKKRCVGIFPSLFEFIFLNIKYITYKTSYLDTYTQKWDFEAF